MDMSKESVSVYLATLQAVIDIMNNLPNATVKKVRTMLEEEIEQMRNSVKVKEH